MAPDRPAVAPGHPTDARRIITALAPFRTACNRRASIELAITAVPFALFWFAAVAAVSAGYWIGLALAVPAGAFLLRLFLIQHDCGHGSYFRQRSANGWTGRVLGVLTLTPYEFWRQSHAHHHAGTGNLDRRGLGDIDTLTLAEYRGLPAWRRCAYRLYRHPAVLFGIGPAFQFLVKHRVPAGLMRGWRPWASALGTNLSVALLWTASMLVLGVGPFLLVQLAVTLVAATGGMWLFYVQHQFPGTTWRRSDEWKFHEAALHGSSFYDLPRVLRWVTADIGVHHVHHLCSTIPFYRMQDALRTVPDLAATGRLGLRASLATVRLALWSEQAGRMISFREAKHC